MKRCRLKPEVQHSLISNFVDGKTSREVAKETGVNKNTVSFYFHRLREIIYKHSESHESVIEDRLYNKKVNERVSISPLFYLIKYGDKIRIGLSHTIKKNKLAIKNVEKRMCKHNELNTCETKEIFFKSVDSSDTKLNAAEFRHMYVGKADCCNTECYCNNTSALSEFGEKVKKHLKKYNGIPASNVHLFLKECEWMLNTPDAQQRLATLEKWVEESA